MDPSHKPNVFYATTIVSVRRNGQVLAGFAGAAADAFTLFELFESKLENTTSSPAPRSNWRRIGAPSAVSASSKRCSRWPTGKPRSSSAAPAM